MKRTTYLIICLSIFLFACEREGQMIKYPDGSVYTGDLKDGLRHGYGVMKYPSGWVVEGEFKEGLRHGYVVSTNPEKVGGDFISTQYKDGVRHGPEVRYGENDSIIYRNYYINGKLKR